MGCPKANESFHFGFTILAFMSTYDEQPLNFADWPVQLLYNKLDEKEIKDAQGKKGKSGRVKDTM